MHRLLQVAYYFHSLANKEELEEKENKIMNMEHLVMAFELMGLGMAGVFIVLGILYAVAELLIKLLPAK